MRVLDLFSGIGGFSLGLERAEFETVAFCEIEEYPRKILAKHWPEIPIYKDIRKLTKEKLDNDEIGSIDVICGGFPCQPFSVAGKQAGKEDDRHLWPEMLRLIRETKPTWVIGENVAGFIRMALDDVLLDLENEGYTAQSFVIPACAVGAVHRRDRVWIIAYSEHNGSLAAKIRGGVDSAGDNNTERQDEAIEPTGSGESASGGNLQKCEQRFTSDTDSNNIQARSEKPERKGKAAISSCSNVAADSNGLRLQGSENERNVCKNRQEPDDEQPTGCDSSSSARRQNASNSASSGQPGSREHGKPFNSKKGETGQAINAEHGSQGFIGIPTQPPVRHRDDGLSDNMARLKALGNAVVPQIPEMIGRAILGKL